jgi:hypothetical protein
MSEGMVPSPRKHLSDVPSADYLHLRPQDIEPGDSVQISHNHTQFGNSFRGYEKLVSISRAGFMPNRPYKARFANLPQVFSLDSRSRYWVIPHDWTPPPRPSWMDIQESGSW